MAYVKKFWKYRELLLELVEKDLKNKYRKSVLGYLWSLLNPLLMMMVIASVFSHLFKYDIPNFPIYLLTGQIMFNFFNESTNLAMNSIVINTALIKKVNFPKYIFPVSKVLSSFVNLLFSLLAIIIMLIITKTPISFSIVLFPLPLIYILLFSMGIGLILATLTVFFRDIFYLYGILLTAWTYYTPIFYPIDILPQVIKNLMNFNPLYHFIKYFRNIILYGKIPSIQDNCICLGIGIITLAIGLIIFQKKQDEFVFHI